MCSPTHHICVNRLVMTDYRRIRCFRCAIKWKFCVLDHVGWTAGCVCRFCLSELEESERISHWENEPLSSLIACSFSLTQEAYKKWDAGLLSLFHPPQISPFCKMMVYMHIVNQQTRCNIMTLRSM